MTARREGLKARLNKVFCEVFDDDTIKIRDAMTAKNIDGWDSFTHIVLVVAVEKEFKVRLGAAEVGKMTNVGAMLDLLEQRTQ